MLLRPTPGVQHRLEHLHTHTHNTHTQHTHTHTHTQHTHTSAECDEWFGTEYLGLSGGARRFGHTSFVDQSSSSLTVFGGFLGHPLEDMFLLKTGVSHS